MGVILPFVGLELPIDGTVLFIVALLGVSAVAINALIDKKYPKRRFLCINKNVWYFSTYRTNGYQIIEGDWLAILLGRERIGEDLRDFVKVLLTKAGPYSGPIYVSAELAESLLPLLLIWGAEPVKMDLKLLEKDQQLLRDKDGKLYGHKNAELVPLTIKWEKPDGSPYIRPEEVITGQRIGSRKLEAMKYSAAVAKANEPIWVGLMYALPMILALVVALAGIYFVSNAVINAMLSVANGQTIIAQDLHDAAQLLVLHGQNLTGFNLSVNTTYLPATKG